MPQYGNKLLPQLTELINKLIRICTSPDMV
jgi:hypothetical protein